MLIEGETDDEVVDDVIDTGAAADTSTEGAADTGGEGGEEKPQSLRETLLANLAATKEKAVDTTDKTKTGVEKDPATGKFKKADGKPNPKATTSQTNDPNKTAAAVKPLDPVAKAAADAAALAAGANAPVEPIKDRFRKPILDNWKNLPPDVQRELNRREEDFRKAFANRDDEVVLGRRFTEIVGPYMAQMRAEGAEPLKAVAELLNTAYVLRTASPQQKGQLLWRTAQQFGADMRQIPQGQQAFDPNLHAVNQQLAALQAEIKKQDTLRQQQEQAGIDGLIQSFSADTAAHPYFEAVKGEMAALLQGGGAKDLQEAYDKAVWANPDIRSSLLAEQKTAEDKRVAAENAAKAEKAKKAGSSVKGGPGMAASKTAQVAKGSLRAELESAFRAHGGS